MNENDTKAMLKQHVSDPQIAVALIVVFIYFVLATRYNISDILADDVCLYVATAPAAAIAVCPLVTINFPYHFPFFP